MQSGDASQVQPGISYVNYYSFAETASLVVENFLIFLIHNGHTVRGKSASTCSFNRLDKTCGFCWHYGFSFSYCDCFKLWICQACNCKRRGSFNDGESNPTSNSVLRPSICWWKGGMVSCQLFNWKVLPRSLVSKAARQGLHFPSCPSKLSCWIYIWKKKKQWFWISLKFKFCSWRQKDTRHTVSWEFRLGKEKQICCMASSCWVIN